MNYAMLPSVTSANLPKNYEAAKRAISELVSIDECKDWADKAAALASYAKQAQDDELERQCQRVRARAVRRQGELLSQIKTAQGARNDLPTSIPEGQKFRADIARDAGITPKQAQNAVRIASIPEKDFEAQVEAPKPATLSQLAAQGVKPRPVLDLKGRDPRDFNRALHFIAVFEDYAKEVSKMDVESGIAALIEPERAKLRAAINRIDAVHDRIITRI